MFGNLPREKIPWFPTIDFEKCVGCKECFNFCRNGVYEWDEKKDRPIVARPYNCVVGCSACANLCNGEAIKFPSKKELIETISKLQSK
ncbi:MAG: ferredoxin family protein [Candidatus Omnitrophica bacterium]|nr:ferredoxin family protein [Candidatus Omnitrophota bacterium]